MNKFILMALLCLMATLCSCEKTEINDFELPATEQAQENAPPSEVTCGGNGVDDVIPVRTGD